MGRNLSVYYRDDGVTLYHGDALTVAARELADASVDCIVTSPPYYNLRDYDTDGQYGLEADPRLYVEKLRRLFAELRRVLADDGTLWLNLADSYYSRVRGEKTQWKNLIGVPWRVAFALQDDGWILRNAIIWHKPNTMPESVTDRLASRYEHVFLFAKSRRYFFDLDPIREPHSPISINRAQRSARKPYSANGKSGAAKVPGATPYAAISAGSRQINAEGKNPGDYWKIDDEPFELPTGRLSGEEAAYMAAFIDGEGSISIRRRTTQIQFMLTVVNTHEGIIRWLHQRTGMGQIKQREVRNEKWRQVWEWSVTSRQAAQVIYAVYPHLRVKQQQAAVALHFMATTHEAGGGPASVEYHEQRHAMAEDVAALNAGRITESRFAFDPLGPPRTSSAGDVMVIPTQPFAGAHFAVMPVALALRCVQAGCRPGGTVLDPFSGSGTSGAAAAQTGRRYIGIDINRDYLDLSLATRLNQAALDFSTE